MIRTCLSVVLAATIVVAVLAACGTRSSEPDVGDLSGVTEPFEIEEYRELRPEPEVRSIDLRIDTGLDERVKLPRDAILPIYAPKYVPASESQLIDDALVMGIEINGDARAMPVGLMRFREMVNDEIGGVPILATW